MRRVLRRRAKSSWRIDLFLVFFNANGTDLQVGGLSNMQGSAGRRFLSWFKPSNGRVSRCLSRSLLPDCGFDLPLERTLTLRVHVHVHMPVPVRVQTRRKVAVKWVVKCKLIQEWIIASSASCLRLKKQPALLLMTVGWTARFKNSERGKIESWCGRTTTAQFKAKEDRGLVMHRLPPSSVNTRPQST